MIRYANHFFMRRLLLSFLGPLGVVVFLLLAGGCALLGGADSASRQNLSKEILLHPRISLADFHISGYRDNATALDGLRQAATGGPSRRSFYQTAPGGLTNLDVRMLSAMVRTWPGMMQPSTCATTLPL